MAELLNEAGRGVAGLWTDSLAWAFGVAVVVLVGLRLGADRRGLHLTGWPLLVVIAFSLSVHDKAVIPVALAAAGWWGATRSGLQPPRRSGLLLVATLITALGLYGTLPETKETIALLTTLGVVGVAGLAGAVDLRRARPVHVGALAAVLPWVVIAGDGQRSWALLAGFVCLALLVGVVAVQRAPAVIVLTLHALGTAAASRWVGLVDDLGTAARRAAPVLAVTIVVVTALRWYLRGRADGERP